MPSEPSGGRARPGSGTPGIGVADRGEPALRHARLHAMARLMRQLSSGLSAYRLYPGELAQQGFQAALGRIRSAAAEALASGHVEVDIRAGEFHSPIGALPPDESTERLALAFYQHRAERVVISEVPDEHDLAVLYEALSAPPSAHPRGEGVGTILRVSAVTSIQVWEVAPRGSETDGEAPREQSDAERALMARLDKPEDLAEELMDQAGGGTPAERADRVLESLREMLTAVPEHRPDSMAYEKLQRAVAAIPADVRRSFMRALLRRGDSDSLAQRLLGTMTDAELARALVEASAESGEDAAAKAGEMVARGARRQGLVELTEAAMAGREAGGAILAGVDRLGVPVPGTFTSSGSAIADTVSDLLGKGLVSARQRDLKGIRDAWPITPGQQRTMALEAFRDYLANEERLEQLLRALDVWVEDVGAALRKGDQALLEELLGALDPGRGRSTVHEASERATLIDGARRRALEAGALSELVAAAEGGRAEAVVRMLRLFGPEAVDGLLDLLIDEPDRGRRGVLVSLTAELGRGHEDRVGERLSDPRWFVARNAVTILARIGGPAVPPILERAFRHPEVAVRREGVKAMVVVAGADAIPALAAAAADQEQEIRLSAVGSIGSLAGGEAALALSALVRRSPDLPVRSRALHELAEHPSPLAETELGELIAGRPRIPRRLRREAKALLKRRRSASR